MLQKYYRLTKPGIVYGNALPFIAGFLLAAHRRVDVILFVTSLIGSSLVIASACVCNNYLDRGLDKKMSRTKKRALVTGEISNASALLFALCLLVIGQLLLIFSNALTMFLAAFGFFAYVVLYGIAKRRTVHGTLVGSISGALPPVIGYVAVAGHLDWAALSLFLLLVAWQMPHFYAIASYRLNDYKAAGLPVLPLVYGLAATRKQIIAYIIVFCLAISLVGTIGHGGWLFTIAGLLFGGGWLVRGLGSNRDTTTWARRVFLDSLMVLTASCVMLGLSPWLV